MRRLAALLVVLAATGAACSAAAPADLENPTLDDPDVLTRLGVAEPQPVNWQRTLGTVDLLGLTPRANPAEVELVAAAFSELPAALVGTAGLRHLVRTAVAVDTELHPATTAFARGPDIYLLDRTFTEPRAGSGRMAMARILAHEMAHVAQFGALEADYVDAILAGEVTETDTSNGSALVSDFAADAGWSNSSSARYAPRWSLASVAGTTEYGATAPDEDMAEAVSLVVMGRANQLSPERVRWVEEWLGLGADQLAAGKPWAPPGSVEAFFDQPVYDEPGVAALRARHVDPQYFLLPATVAAAEPLAREVSSELRRRGITGVLELTADSRLPRYSGVFSRSDGVRFWVELWDFRAATGFRNPPPGPILAYVTLW